MISTINTNINDSVGFPTATAPKIRSMSKWVRIGFLLVILQFCSILPRSAEGKSFQIQGGGGGLGVPIRTPQSSYTNPASGMDLELLQSSSGQLSPGGEPEAGVNLSNGGGGGDVDPSLLNFLYAKQILRNRLMGMRSRALEEMEPELSNMNSLNNGAIIGDFKKRAYWKQCAFNAVSCFG